MSDSPSSRLAARSPRVRRFMLRALNLYPPYLGAGVRVRVAPDSRTFDVSMKLRWYNRNYVGTQFGGSLYSMCDPFFMLILIEALGPGYVVWDKAATIRFRRPGRGTVRATFTIPDDEIAAIRTLADSGEKIEPTFTTDVVDDTGAIVATVEKVLYVRRHAPREGAAGRDAEVAEPVT